MAENDNSSAVNIAPDAEAILNGVNGAYIETLLASYLQDRNAVDPQWRELFSQISDLGDRAPSGPGAASWRRPDWPVTENGEWVNAIDGNWPEMSAAAGNALGARIAASARAQGGEIGDEQIHHATRDSVRAIMMIRAYRMRGHLHAQLDPLGMNQASDHAELHPQSYGFTEADFDRPIFLDHVLGLEYATLREMLAILRRTYCSTVGVEFMHISNPEEKAWVQQRIEGPDKHVTFTELGKLAIFNKLVEADGFENFLNVKYTGTRRFGLDGGESLIPALEQIIKRGGALGVKDIVMGMAHRGRLSVLANVLGKPLRAIFNEFEGGASAPDDVEGSGDVKYHLGVSADRDFDGNNVHLSLTANPSHLEIVDPVVLGKVRAKQDQLANFAVDTTQIYRGNVLPLLLHGDAAFAGQGVVGECFGLSALRGHRTGGSLHFIINNQIGFTTNPRFSRSSPYPSDVAKMIETPILHCNGDDPEAVVFCAKIATEFRQTFHKPVVVDMICYRRHGHNEADEPAFTQPIMYRKIKTHKRTVDIYADRLVDEGILSKGDIENKRQQWRAKLDGEFERGQSYRPNKADWLDGKWSGMKVARDQEDPRRGKTGVPFDVLKKVGMGLTDIPSGFKAHRTIERFMANRRKMFESGKGVDWAAAEALALGTMLRDGHHIRLSGQDVERGTFSQRHCAIYNQDDESRYIPLNHVGKQQSRFEVINSMLSEEAVLGFEYGYSLAEPNALTLWEAQFGDFANGAQVIFDQFVSSGEKKWLRMSGLVCLLPHGYEGQGPEHSSARLERFLQLCAEDNMQVANCTSPANYFHVLRRQLARDIRKPLILMTPKSRLRDRRVVSLLSEMADETCFHRLLWDDAETDPENATTLAKDAEIRRVILCSGKVYFDLLEERENRKINDIYLLRVEQLYPFPTRALKEELSRFKKAEIIWCQEEPKNMGPWDFVEPYIEHVLTQIKAKHRRAHYVGRKGSAATSTGLMSKHIEQLKKFLSEALSPDPFPPR